MSKRMRVPAAQWLREYKGQVLTDDLLAAVIVTVMLVPQSLAYALLAGLPAQVGLYASILPLIAYMVFGTSATLAVGPVAVISLMTASALAPLHLETVAEYVAAASVLALLSGVMLIAMGVLRLGALSNLLSHPVVAGFITASGLLIALSQVKHLLGIQASGHTAPELIRGLWQARQDANLETLVIAFIALAMLLGFRKYLTPLLISTGMPLNAARTTTRVAPVFAVAATLALTWGLGLDRAGVAVVGEIPKGFPPLTVPKVDWTLLSALWLPAVMLSVIGYVESVSVAQTLASKRKQRIEPNQELYALGAANIASGVSGGFPVTGGFSRSVVNFDAGARTPAAGGMAALGLLLSALFLTPVLYYLPKATLAATIVVAVLSLVDLSILSKAWRYSRADFAAVLATILGTLILGVEAGVALGVALSLGLFLWKTTRPHVAEVGLVPGTQHFRNVLRHKVETDPSFVTLRPDESLYFANARRLEDLILRRIHQNPEQIQDIVLMCSAINEVDLSALESLEMINERLHDMGVALHLSEVKGPVMDRLSKTDFLAHLTGQVFLSQFDAHSTLMAAPNNAALSA